MDKAEIDWEQRRWELTCMLCASATYSVKYNIEMAETICREYRKTLEKE